MSPEPEKAEISHWGTAEPCLLGSQGKDLLLQLEDETLKLVEPQNQTLLHAQPIVSIRVWGVGRDSGRWARGTLGRLIHLALSPRV